MSIEGKLSPAMHAKIFKERIERPMLASTQSVKQVEQLTAIFLGGQPGAGKGGLAQRTREELREINTILIDVDELRTNHPDYEDWQLNPATEKIAADLTHADASAWGKALFASAIANKRNIIVDGTLGNPVSAEKQFAMLKDAGYSVIVRGLAVQPEVSHLGVLKRFEVGKQTGVPRWVPAEVERIAYEGLPKTLHMAEQKQVEYNVHVQVFDRRMEKLHDNREVKALDGGKPEARYALAKERQRPLNASELEDYAKDWNAVIGSMTARKAPADEIAAAARLASAMCPGLKAIESKVIESKSPRIAEGLPYDLLSMPATPTSRLLARADEPRIKSAPITPK